MLIVKNVKKSFSHVNVIADVDFQVSEGEFVSIIGKSGCGKSTLLNILSGLVTPDEGEIYLDNKCITNMSGMFGYMHQDDLLLPWYTIIDNVCLPLIIKKIPKLQAYKKARSHFEKFGLTEVEKNYPRQLSGGMRQRASLLRTYLFGSDIILFDEPFAKLDAITKVNMHKWLKNILQQTRKTTCIFVTHDIDEAIYLSDRIFVLSPKPTSIVKEFVLQSHCCRRENILQSDEVLDIKNEILSTL